MTSPEQHRLAGGAEIMLLRHALQHEGGRYSTVWPVFSAVFIIERIILKKLSKGIGTVETNQTIAVHVLVISVRPRI